MRTPTRAIVMLMLCAAALLGAAAPATAHANLTASDPSDGATLSQAPHQISITFSEQPDPRISGLIVYDAAGTQVGQIGDPVPHGDRTLVWPVGEDLPDGVYTAVWTTTSVEDGHQTSSSFTFGIGVKPTGPSAAVPLPKASGPTPLGVVSKALLYAGLMLLVAIVVVGIGVFGGAPDARARVGAWAGVAAAIGAIGFVWAQQRASTASFGRYLSSEAGRIPIEIAIVTLIAATLAVAGARASQRWLPWAAGAAAAIALALRAHGGHAAAAPLPLLAQIEQFVHIVAGACWAGGLVLLVLLIRERRADPPLTLARRYSTVALIAIAVVVTTGVLRAVAELGGLDDVVRIWSSAYGRTLAIKVAVVLVVIALGARNRYRSLARLDRDAHPLLRVAGAELVAAAGILALTATLTSFAPPLNAASPPPHRSDDVTMTGSDLGTTVQASITVTPGQPGPNVYQATFTRFGTSEPFPADGAVLQLRSVTRPDVPGATVTLKPTGTGWTAKTINPSIAGTFLATVQLRTAATVVQIPLTLITRSTGRITTTLAPEDETVAVASFDDGVRVQGTSSATTPTQVHVTAFDPAGNELPLDAIAIVASPAGGRPARLTTERFSKGHFAAGSTLAPGSWTFDVIATARDGTAYQVTWSSTVPAASAVPTISPS
jgi:copper transport protein